MITQKWAVQWQRKITPYPLQKWSMICSYNGFHCQKHVLLYLPHYIVSEQIVKCQILSFILKSVHECVCVCVSVCMMNKYFPVFRFAQHVVVDFQNHNTSILHLFRLYPGHHQVHVLIHRTIFQSVKVLLV